ncbi:phenylalanine--tRNA ligase beta subunit-related protein [Pendulispora albinea]|uniref:B3/B4 tRNA-binding domain-containing protein n=1 Tax=Pendulispora albinea TaxID=2741071 RepID=A0ABZ2LWW1_9BACT
MLALTIDPHPLLDVAVFVTTFSKPLAETDPSVLGEFLRADATTPHIHHDDAIRGAVRDLLRHGGYKPTGRGKPASEYLIRAAADGGLRSINAAVDACNAVSLHSGLPISVIDLDLASTPLSIAVAPAGARYIFNPAGQEIDLEGLLCLVDAHGPCANAVKDAQRTKTNDETLRTLSIVWGTLALPEHTSRTTSWYQELLAKVGAKTEPVNVH